MMKGICLLCVVLCGECIYFPYKLYGNQTVREARQGTFLHFLKPLYKIYPTLCLYTLYFTSLERKMNWKQKRKGIFIISFSSSLFLLLSEKVGWGQTDNICVWKYTYIVSKERKDYSLKNFWYELNWMKGGGIYNGIMLTLTLASRSAVALHWSWKRHTIHYLHTVIFTLQYFHFPPKHRILEGLVWIVFCDPKHLAVILAWFLASLPFSFHSNSQHVGTGNRLLELELCVWSENENDVEKSL